MSCELDPKEVLIHLHELGYYNITPEQLKEFIKDLEKLIQHDVMKKKKKIVQQHCQDDSLSSPLPNTTDESVSSSPPPASDPPDHRNHSHAVRKPSKNLENISCSSSESSVAPTRRVLRECTKHLSLKNQEREELFRCRPKSADASNSKAPLKPPKTCDCAWRRIGCKCCEELMSQEQNSLKTKSKENLAPPRPKSSFIRTWQTQAGSYRTQRCDPVALYQQYQQVWKQQKLPGEDNHNDLRWSVRERLLGQQPLPRSCRCDCKCPCKLNERDFSKDPKKVFSKKLPRSPFHVEGWILGPMGHQRDGECEIREKRLRGVIEVESDSSEDKKIPDCLPHRSKIVNNQHGKRAIWLSKGDIDKTKESNQEHNVTQEKLESHRKNHDRSTCKYCGLIHYMLSSPEGTDSNNKSARNYYPNENPDMHAIFDSKKKDCNCNTNDMEKNKNLPMESQNQRQCDPQGRSNIRVLNQNKDTSSRGYWHQELSFESAQKAINEIRKKLESDCSRVKYHHQRFESQAPPAGCIKNCTAHSVESSPPREQWPRQFTVQADVHRPDVSNPLSPGSKCTRPTSTPVNSTPTSRWSRPTEPIPHLSPLCDRREYRPELNLATASPAQKTQRHSESYFETKIPVTLKGFQGEVKTEVEVHKKQRYDEGSKCPLVTVATKVKIHKI